MAYLINESTALLDRAVLNKIRIDGFDDFETLQSKGIVVVNPKSKVDYICPSGQEFTSLQITGDGIINNMVAGARILGNSRVEYCSVSTSPKREDGTNVRCYTINEYTAHLTRLQGHLRDVYGIRADFSMTQFKELEINKTFRLEQDFRDYRRVIELIMHNLPASFKQDMTFSTRTKQDKNSGMMESQPGTYYARTGKNNKSDRYLLFKIYDKTRSVENTITLTDSYMRIELRLVGAEKIARDLGTNVFSEITDQIINEYFDKQMQKLIIQPIKKWKAQRDKMVVALMKEKQEQDIKHWQVNTLLTLSSMENEQYCPVLLDVSELMELVPQVVTGRKLRYKAKTNFRTKARKNAECFCRNDDKKLAEILSKVV